jgi:hypothetical protein
MDRRVDSRLDVRLPCYVAFPSSNSRRFAGVTENMSRNGMLVSWRWEDLPEGLPRPGEVLTAEIELPASRHFGRRCMHCQVTVVRVATEEPGRARVAFRVNHMQFRNYATGRFARGGFQDVVSRSQPVM